MQLINARYKLNEEEIDFLILLIEHIGGEIISFKSEKYDLKFIKKISSKTLEMTTTNSSVFINWFTKIEFDNEKSIFIVNIKDEVREFLLKLKKDLSNEDLKYFFLLSSNYSRAIYKLLKAYEHKSNATVNLEDLKNRLQIPKGLHLYSNFKMKVLNIAQEELKKTTDISFNIQEKKDGKKVTSLIFNICSAEELESLKIEEKEDVRKNLLSDSLEIEAVEVKTESLLVQNAVKSLDKKLSPENEEIKRIVSFFDLERKKLQPNFVRREFKNVDGEWLLRVHLKETGRTPKMFFDAIRWLFSSNPQATFHRQNIMNIAKLIENFNTIEHQAMYSQKAVSFNEEAQSWYNIYKKRGLSESEILEILKDGGFL